MPKRAGEKTGTGRLFIVHRQAAKTRSKFSEVYPLQGLAALCTEEESRQISLFDTTDYEKQEKADAAMDAIRERFGAGAIKRAAFLKPAEK